MKSILMRLYEGELHPEEQFAPETEEYKRLWKERYRDYKSFIARLREISPDLEKGFIELMDKQLYSLPFLTSEMFLDGFCLGARMMIEIYQRKLSEE